jgi:hypothetical protein
LLVITSDTARDGSEFSWALNLLELEVWVVGILEPVKSPVATVLEELGECITL